MSFSYVLQKMTEAVQARAAERRAFEEYGGYSWGYVGAPLIEAATKAEEEAEQALSDFIDHRIYIAKGLK